MSHYADYLADPERLFLPELPEGVERLHPKTTVWGVEIAGMPLAVPEDWLRAGEVLCFTVRGFPVVLVQSRIP